eukprot:TRINITY_DN21466_c0_g1_i1.p1 TRINITY_DN21466_c0_g1~~TRINITY_DN21466_c0_g1_i1.p1  ORF type:complete len:204 (-),score=21.89 TRINITY_DN21466_c0_g1_i1:371-982(-)
MALMPDLEEDGRGSTVRDRSRSPRRGREGIASNHGGYLHRGPIYIAGPPVVHLPMWPMFPSWELHEAWEQQAARVRTIEKENDEQIRNLQHENNVQRQLVEQQALEIQKLQGHPETMRGLPMTELTDLRKQCMQTLDRIHQEYDRRMEEHDRDTLCAVCMVEQRNVVLQPCNHFSMCSVCLSSCAASCPQCRTPVQGHLLVYS